MALYFAGDTGNYAEITNGYGNTLSNTSGTVSFWAKPIYNYGVAIATKGLGTEGLIIETGGSAGSAYLGINNAYSAWTHASFVSDTWVHVVLSGNGTTGGGPWSARRALVSINGNLAGQHGSDSKWQTSAANLYLGRWDNGTYSYSGWLGDIRIWNRVLSEAETYAVYCNQDVASGLVERWPLTESSGSTITGTIGGNNGTITGTPVWGGTAIPYGTPASSGGVRMVNIRGGADQ